MEDIIKVKKMRSMKVEQPNINRLKEYYENLYQELSLGDIDRVSTEMKTVFDIVNRLHDKDKRVSAANIIRVCPTSMRRKLIYIISLLKALEKLGLVEFEPKTKQVI